MSSSNIIKLHNLRPRGVVIDPGGLPIEAGDIGRHDEEGVDLPNADGDEANAGAGPDNEEPGAHTFLTRRQAGPGMDLAHEHLEAEAKEIRRQAYEEGYQSGYAEGLVAAKAEALESVRRLSELARDAAVDMACALKTAEGTVVELALGIAEKIVCKRLGEDRSIVMAMVRGALDCADPMEVMRVRVNPEDVDALRSHWQAGQVGGAGRTIELAADPSVQPGGCIIDTRSSILDAQIETKLAEIGKALRAEMEASAR